LQTKTAEVASLTVEAQQAQAAVDQAIAAREAAAQIARADEQDLNQKQKRLTEISALIAQGQALQARLNDLKGNLIPAAQTEQNDVAQRIDNLTRKLRREREDLRILQESQQELIAFSRELGSLNFNLQDDRRELANVQAQRDSDQRELTDVTRQLSRSEAQVAPAETRVATADRAVRDFNRRNIEPLRTQAAGLTSQRDVQNSQIRDLSQLNTDLKIFAQRVVNAQNQIVAIEARIPVLQAEIARLEPILATLKVAWDAVQAQADAVREQIAQITAAVESLYQALKTAEAEQDKTVGELK
jgi:chromosome segregation ATPase